MSRKVHTFSNGVRVYDDHLIPKQRERYKIRNLHEPEEEEVFLRILDSIEEKGIYLNVGSAIGYYPLLAKNHIPHLEVHVVEPLRRHRKYFKENIRLNGFNCKDFVLHPEGIAATCGRARLVDQGYGSGIRGEVTNESPWLKWCQRFLPGENPQKMVPIKTTTLDSLLGRLNSPVNVCQIDVQGFEGEVLKGAETTLRTHTIEHFLIGTHSENLHQTCMDILLSNGYEIRLNEYETVSQPDGILWAAKQGAV